VILSIVAFVVVGAIAGASFVGGYMVGVEHGPCGGDELNRVVEGKNYGWPQEVLGTM